MKKILCSLAVASLSFVSAQISVSESFATTPTIVSGVGFTFVGFSGSTTTPIPCTTGDRAMNKSFFNGSSTNATNALIYSSNKSNGGKLSISFRYKHPASSGTNPKVDGSFKVEYSVDGQDYVTLNSYELKTSQQFCQNYTATIEEGIVPKDKDFKLKISGAYVSGDYYLVVDDFAISQTTPTLAVDTFGKTQMSIYPNPVNNVINLSNNKDVARLVVTDLSGRTVKVIENPASTNDVSALKSGNYIINVLSVNGTTESFKIIKK